MALPRRGISILCCDHSTFRRSPSPMRSIVASFLNSLRPRGDDDFVDRLNYYYTPCVLLVSATVVGAKQYVAKPIQCWVPPHFIPPMEEYIENYCWIQNTYWVPMHEHIPDDLQSREKRQIGYYQWVPFILLLQAFLFALPCLLWRLTNWRSGLNLHYLVTAACDLHSVGSCDRQKAITDIANNLRDVLDLQNGLVKTMDRPKFRREDNYKKMTTATVAYISSCSLRCLRLFRHSGCYVTFLYLCTKIAYACNVVAQFFLLNAFLKSDEYPLYGIRVLSDFAHGREWAQSGHFPRITLCDFEVRSLGNLNRYTVQCALAANMFNEKVFVFVWCWLAVIGMATTASLAFWLFNTVFATQRSAFVLQYLRIAFSQDADERHFAATAYHATTFAYDRFVDRYLGADGVLTLRMIANHAGDVVTMHMVKNLWRTYRDTRGMDDVVLVIPNSDTVTSTMSVNMHHSQHQQNHHQPLKRQGAHSSPSEVALSMLITE